MRTSPMMDQATTPAKLSGPHSVARTSAFWASPLGFVGSARLSSTSPSNSHARAWSGSRRVLRAQIQAVSAKIMPTSDSNTRTETHARSNSSAAPSVSPKLSLNSPRSRMRSGWYGSKVRLL